MLHCSNKHERMNNMKLSKGSNQHQYKHKLNLSKEAQRDICLLIAIMALLFCGGREYVRNNPVISPCDESGCFVSKIEAQEIEARIELRQLLKDQANPTKANIISYIARKWEKHGTAETVKAINCFYSESGLNTEAYGYNNNGTSDYGIAQINTIHGMSVTDMKDYRKNIDKAHDIYMRRGWSAWYGKLCR